MSPVWRRPPWYLSFPSPGQSKYLQLQLVKKALKPQKPYPFNIYWVTHWLKILTKWAEEKVSRRGNAGTGIFTSPLSCLQLCPTIAIYWHKMLEVFLPSVHSQINHKWLHYVGVPVGFPIFVCMHLLWESCTACCPNFKLLGLLHIGEKTLHL